MSLHVQVRTARAIPYGTLRGNSCSRHMTSVVSALRTLFPAWKSILTMYINKNVADLHGYGKIYKIKWGENYRTIQ